MVQYKCVKYVHYFSKKELQKSDAYDIIKTVKEDVTAKKEGYNMRDLRNSEWVFYVLIDTYESLQDSLEFRQFDKNLKISNCYGNRWFYICDNSNYCIGIIDDQTGRMMTVNYSNDIDKSLLKLYALSDNESYKKYGFSKCEEWVQL